MEKRVVMKINFDNEVLSLVIENKALNRVFKKKTGRYLSYVYEKRETVDKFKKIAFDAGWLRDYFDEIEKVELTKNDMAGASWIESFELC